MTNSAAIGYMILAAKAFAMPKAQIKRLEREMQWQMDMKTEAEAEEAYRKS
jgi:hypothetical protein